jgi:hypothetical protein
VHLARPCPLFIHAVSLAVILSAGLVFLCVYWVYNDRKFKARAKNEARLMAESVAAEKAKVAAVSGISFGAAGATAPAAGGAGYARLH